MTIDRNILSPWVPRIQVLIILALLFGFRDSPVTVVNAFASTSTGAKLAQSTFYYTTGRQHTPQIKTPRTVLCALKDQIEIRDFRLTDSESKKIYNFLLQREQDERKKTKIFFDPEGSLELDVSNKWTLAESYSRDDDGCFLVAMEGNRSQNDDGENDRIVGTLGMIAGTQVFYQTSGSSLSTPEIMAALRRVCAMGIGNSEDGTTKDSKRDTSATEMLKELIRQGEQRALQSGATNLIGMAYPEISMSEGSDVYDENKIIVKPTVSLFESLGYQVSEHQIPGVTTMQYEKKLSENHLVPGTSTENLESTSGRTEVGQWIIPATIASIFSLGWLVFNLYSNVFGIEQLWGSIDNGGVGTSLSSQNLEELIRDEKLGRSGLDDGIGSATVRQWEDLSPEELREEQALMKVIQGQSIRSK